MPNGKKKITQAELRRIRGSVPILPVRGAWISQGVHKGHVAVDFAVQQGTPIVSVGEGIVSSVQNLTTGYGRHVRIKTPRGEELIYAHMHDIGVRLGQRIRKGMQLGTVGSTGNSTGAHLHFERRVAGEAVDPWVILKGAIEPNYDALRYGTSPRYQSQLARVPSSGIQSPVRRAKEVKIPVSSRKVRSVAPSPNFNLVSGYPAPTVREEKKEEKETLPQQVVSAVKAPVERFSVGALGVVLMITGLFILSSGLRQKTLELGKEATKVLVGSATGGVGGAVAGAVA